MEKNKKDFGKYVISAFLIIAGIVPFVKYIQGDELESQPMGMLLSGIALIIVGVIALPEILNKINQKVYKLLLTIGVLGAFGLAYAVVTSVGDEIDFQKTKKRVQALTIQRMKDIREAQLAHKSVYGTYATDFDSLFSFVNANVMPVTFNMGSFHDTLPESKSFEEGYVVKRGDLDSLALILNVTAANLLSSIQEDLSPYKIRDTLYTSFFAENLTVEARIAQKLPSLSIDSLPFNPYSGERFVMKTSIVEVGGLWQPTLLVTDPTPFGREKVKKDTLRFGSLTEAHTDGNWRN